MADIGGVVGGGVALHFVFEARLDLRLVGRGPNDGIGGHPRRKFARQPALGAGQLGERVGGGVAGEFAGIHRDGGERGVCVGQMVSAGVCGGDCGGDVCVAPPNEWRLCGDFVEKFGREHLCDDWGCHAGCVAG